MKKRFVGPFLPMCLLAATVSVSPATAADESDAMDRIESMMKTFSKLKVSGYVQARYEKGEASSDTLVFPSPGSTP